MNTKIAPTAAAVTNPGSRHDTRPPSLHDVANLPIRPGRLAELATDENPEMRRAVASNPEAPKDALAGLATDENPKVRIAVASNPEAPEDALAGLATDENPKARRAVASNPRTPKAAFAVLVTDEDLKVRENVASNPSAHSDALTTLSIDANWPVRKAVATNPSTPTGVVYALSLRDEHYLVREAAEKHLEIIVTSNKKNKIGSDTHGRDPSWHYYNTPPKDKWDDRRPRTSPTERIWLDWPIIGESDNYTCSSQPRTSALIC